jgi:hypothetical protein
MSTRFTVQLEQAYNREVLLALEVLDAVTMTRVSDGLTVVADGLLGKPIVNSSGYFVWLKENLAGLQKITINPGTQPYEPYELSRLDVKFPLTIIELQPRADYEFASGLTGLRGTLIERRVIPLQPVTDAQIKLLWLDDNGQWQNAPNATHTNAKTGDFVSILRLAPKQIPEIDVNGAVTVRLQVGRSGATRSSNDLKLLQGRITDPTTLNPLTFAWDELQP